MSSLAEGDLEWSCELMEKRNLRANISLGIVGTYVHVYMQRWKKLFLIFAMNYQLINPLVFL